MFDYRIDPHFYRVLPGTLTPLTCNGCGPLLVFDHVADGTFAYVGAPDVGWVRAIPLAGGNAVTLASGDVWNVLQDDAALYFTDVNGGRLGRIAKD